MGFITDLFGGKEAGQAGREVEKGFGQSIDTYRDAEGRAREEIQPYSRLGMGAAETLQSTLFGGGEPDYSRFRDSPGYQFAREEGTKARERAGSARGMQLSGAQQKSLARFGTGLAEQTYGNWFNRMLQLSNLGMGAGSRIGDYALSTGANVGAAQQGKGQARASGYLAKGNIKNYLASSIHESGQRIGEAWASPGAALGGGAGGG